MGKVEVDERIDSCHILADCVLVATERNISLYTSELEPIQNSTVSLNDIIPGLFGLTQFSSQTYAENSPFIMLASIKDLEQIESNDIPHTYTG